MSIIINVLGFLVLASCISFFNFLISMLYNIHKIKKEFELNNLDFSKLNNVLFKKELNKLLKQYAGDLDKHITIKYTYSKNNRKILRIKMNYDRNLAISERTKSSKVLKAMKDVLTLEYIINNQLI